MFIRLLASYVAVKAVRRTEEPSYHVYFCATCRLPCYLLHGNARMCILVSGGSVRYVLLTPARLFLRAKRHLSRHVMKLWRTVSSGIFNTLMQCEGFHVGAMENALNTLFQTLTCLGTEAHHHDNVSWTPLCFHSDPTNSPSTMKFFYTAF